MKEQKREGPPRCANIVSTDGLHTWQCSRPGHALSADGKHYCKQHHPETVAARRQERDRKWKADMEARDRAIAEAEAQKRQLGIGEADADGGLLLTAAEARLLAEYLVEGDAGIRDGWRRRLLTFDLERRRHDRADA